MYEHGRHRILRNSVTIKHMRKQCVPGTLSPPPPLRLGTRLLLTFNLAYLLEIVTNEHVAIHSTMIVERISDHTFTVVQL